MVPEATEKTGRLCGLMPTMPARDLDASIRHYVEHLGWSEAWRWPEDSPTHACVCRDDVMIMLAVHQAADGPLRPRSAYIFVDGIDVYHAICVERGANVSGEPAVSDYGMRDFSVVDPDGNELTFGESAPEPASP